MKPLPTSTALKHLQVPPTQTQHMYSRYTTSCPFIYYCAPIHFVK